MPHSIPDAELDARLDRLKACTRVYACTAVPANFAGIAAISCGYYDLDSGDWGASADNTRSQGGRQTTFAAQSGNNATANGTVNHLVFVIQGSSEIRRVVPCPNAVFTSGQPFAIASMDFVEADPVAVVA
jgi:hypothetical protein